MARNKQFTFRICIGFHFTHLKTDSSQIFLKSDLLLQRWLHSTPHWLDGIGFKVQAIQLVDFHQQIPSKDTHFTRSVSADAIHTFTSFNHHVSLFGYRHHTLNGRILRLLTQYAIAYARGYCACCYLKRVISRGRNHTPQRIH